MECLLCGDGPLQRFGPTLQEISLGFQNLSAVGQKTAVEIYHAKEALQLFDILRGGGDLKSCGQESQEKVLQTHIFPN